MTDPSGGQAAAPAHRWAAWWGLGIWAVIVLIGVSWGSLVIRHDADQGILAAPFVGTWRLGVDGRLLRLLPAVALAALVVAAGPWAAARLRWPLVPVLAGATSSLAAFLLAASDGLAEVARPLATRFEYLAVLPEISDPIEFLDTFVARAATYPIHVKGHPPGAPLAFWLLDAIGLGGAAWAAALVIAGGGVAVAATLVAAWSVGGERTARAAAPFLVITPSILWVATSADGLFAGVIATGIALLVVATCRPDGGAADGLALAGGAVLGLALHLTYGAVPLLLLPLVVAVSRRRLRPLLVAAVGAAVVTGAFAAAGFWWFEGLALTRDFYWEGIASRRPWPYHLLAGNPALLTISVGPATAGGLGVLAARLRERRRSASDDRAIGFALLPLAALAAVAIANASMLSKGEVERIWLPFIPWIALAAGGLARDRRWGRWWLVPPAVITVSLQAVLDSPW